MSETIPAGSSSRFEALNPHLKEGEELKQLILPQSAGAILELSKPDEAEYPFEIIATERNVWRIRLPEKIETTVLSDVPGEGQEGQSEGNDQAQESSDNNTEEDGQSKKETKQEESLPPDLTTLKQILEKINKKDDKNFTIDLRIQEDEVDDKSVYKYSLILIKTLEEGKETQYYIHINPKDGKISLEEQNLSKQPNGEIKKITREIRIPGDIPEDIKGLIEQAGKKEDDIIFPPKPKIKADEETNQKAQQIFEEYLDFNPDFYGKNPEEQIRSIEEFIEKYLDTSNLKDAKDKIELFQELLKTAGIAVETDETFDEHSQNLELAKLAIEEASKNALINPDSMKDLLIRQYAQTYLPHLQEAELNNLIEEAKKEIQREQTAKVNKAINQLYYRALDKKNLTNPTEIILYITNHIKVSPNETYLLPLPIKEYIELLARPRTRQEYLLYQFKEIEDFEIIQTTQIEHSSERIYNIRLKLQELRQQLREEGFRDSEIEYLIKSGQITFTDPDLQNQLLIEFSLKSPEEMPEGNILTPTQIAKLAESQENDAATAEMRKIELKIAERELKNKVPSKLSHLKKQWNVFWKILTGEFTIRGAVILGGLLTGLSGTLIIQHFVSLGIMNGILGTFIFGGSSGLYHHLLAKRKIREEEIKRLKIEKQAKEIKFRRRQQKSVEKLWERLEKYFRSTEPTVDKDTAAILKILGISDRKTETIRNAREKLMRYYETMQDEAGYILDAAYRISQSNIHLATVT